MKSYDTGSLISDPTKEPKKRKLSYDIDIQETNDTYDDIEPVKTKSDYVLTYIMLTVGVVIIFALSVLFMKSRNPSATDNSNEATNDYQMSDGSTIYFTEIDTENEYALYRGDAIAFPCSSNNTNVDIEYVVDDLTTNTRLCNIIKKGGETFEFQASDYIIDSSKHNLMITQNAYNSSDELKSNVLQSTYSQITVVIQ